MVSLSVCQDPFVQYTYFYVFFSLNQMFAVTRRLIIYRHDAICSVGDFLFCFILLFIHRTNSK